MQQLEVPYVKIIPVENNEGPIIKNHSAVIYQNIIYLFGGFDGKTNHKSLYSYNTLTNQWERPATTGHIPEGRNGHTCTLIKSRMYLIGGWLGSIAYSSEDTFVLDLDELVWTIQKTHGQFPGPCNMHSSDAIGGRYIYVFRGGDGKDYLNDLHRLDTETLEWQDVEAKGTLPPSRANHGSAVLDRRIYIFGGWNGMKRLNDLYEFCVDTHEWSEVLLNAEIMPAPRAGMSMCAVNTSQIYLFGGSGANSSCFNDIHIFDSKTKTWQVAAVIDGEITSRTGHSMTPVDDQLVVIGGSMGTAYKKDFFVLEIDPAPPLHLKDGNRPDLKKTLLQSMAHLFQNELLSDIQFNVKGEIFPAHKIIIALLCQHFQNMFSSGMKEESELVIIYDDIDPFAFEIVLYYLYTGEVVIDENIKSVPANLMQVFMVADLFLIDELKFECEILMLNLINEKNFQEIFEFADQNFAPNLFQYCQWYHNKHFAKNQNTKILQKMEEQEYDDEEAQEEQENQTNFENVQKKGNEKYMELKQKCIQKEMKEGDQADGEIIEDMKKLLDK